MNNQPEGARRSTDIAVSRPRYWQKQCRRKRRYASWDDADAAAMLVWQENPRPEDANPPGPYPCNVGGEWHYHYGHLRFSKRSRWKANQRARKGLAVAATPPSTHCGAPNG